MFKKAQFKLTVFYSVLFLFLFWIFSIGLYFWMENSFGAGFISKVKEVQQQQSGQYQGEFDDKKTVIVTIAGNVALKQLQNILLVLNGTFLFLIPAISWFLAKRTLRPIEVVHTQQKQFVSDASHELKTPLSIMNGEMEIVLKKNRKVQDYKQIIISNKEEVGRLTKLVESLLFLAKDDQNRYVNHKISVDLTDVLNVVRTQLQQRIREKKLTVHFRPTSDSIIVQAQEDMLKQLFFNILDNAIKYTPPQGVIQIVLRKNKQEAVVIIQDTGVGIPLTEQERIFDRFYRVDSSRSEIKGYGLGLSIAKTIVEKHKGKIEIESTEGKGTAVSVMLPYV